MLFSGDNSGAVCDASFRRGDLGLGQGVDPRVHHGEVLSVVVYDLALPEFTDQFDCLAQHRDPLRGRRPAVAEDQLVERLARPDPETEVPFAKQDAVAAA